jgi:hypothetical protein
LLDYNYFSTDTTHTHTHTHTHTQTERKPFRKYACVFTAILIYILVIYNSQKFASFFPHAQEESVHKWQCTSESIPLKCQSYRGDAESCNVVNEFLASALWISQRWGFFLAIFLSVCLIARKDGSSRYVIVLRGEECNTRIL